jgi:hypothetical protein
LPDFSECACTANDRLADDIQQTAVLEDESIHCENSRIPDAALSRSKLPPVGANSFAMGNVESLYRLNVFSRKKSLP